ncbi:hypothetical protein ACIRPK_29335 [Kitasatospora sp. NPDC101801]|uniref:hypothetical protein n=1 Tax=Kitasatospora sp. NPDC101801 TaxID=3364103 RepID=UPI003828165C
MVEVLRRLVLGRLVTRAPFRANSRTSSYAWSARSRTSVPVTAPSVSAAAAARMAA